MVALPILDSLLLDDDVEVTSDCVPEMLTDSNGTNGSNLFVSIAVQLVGNNSVARNPPFRFKRTTPKFLQSNLYNDTVHTANL